MAETAYEPLFNQPRRETDARGQVTEHIFDYQEGSRSVMRWLLETLGDRRRGPGRRGSLGAPPCREDLFESNRFGLATAHVVVDRPEVGGHGS